MPRSIARVFGLTAVLVFLWISMASAESTTLRIQLDAADRQRNNAPVSVLVELPQALAAVDVVELTLPEGKTVLGQLTDPGLLAEAPEPAEGKIVRELHFIVPSLAKGQKVTAVQIAVSHSTSARGAAFPRRLGEDDGDGVPHGVPEAFSPTRFPRQRSFSATPPTPQPVMR